MIIMHDRTYRNRLNQIKDLEKDNERLNLQVGTLQTNQKDLQLQIDYLLSCCKIKQARINKAIEFIENNRSFWFERLSEVQIVYYKEDDKHLIDILKGSDK